MSNSQGMRTITRAEVEKHHVAGDAWIVINDNVYDVSKFAIVHPGGDGVLAEYYGHDASEVFYSLHRHDVLEKYHEKLCIGRIEGSEETSDTKITTHGEISSVPYAEHPFWHGYESAYFNESHDRYRKEIRKFLHEEVRSIAEQSEVSNAPPTDEMFRKLGKFGILASRIGPGEHLKYAPSLPGGVKPEEFDYFHELIAHEEVGRLACPGFVDGIGSGMVIGLPPVIQFGPQWMKEKISREILSGEKRICLAITEPYAGSDVASIKTTAVLNKQGTHYIVNGQKKWITGGCESQYFTTAVRTGGEGMGGISLLLIERGEGVETRRIKTAYSSAAGTSYITFDNVMVPVENLIGKENQGFLCIMYNFNHERWMIICYIVAAIRGTIEECWKWTVQRKAFGKPLIQQPVVRMKLANMVSQMEAASSWLEAITYQMCKMPYDMQSMRLGGTMSLLKYYATRVASSVSDDAVQLFGGRAITAGGMGIMIERFQRTHKFASILGGSEEIMADLGIKMAQRAYPSNARL